ncbi:N-6 DNA methylase [Clostridium perfringens]|nr:type I restriction-modification system subunit M [Clostridium perfringens]MDY4420725.1 class I SAM-dependent DNA methyltransferase [Clostridium perfringens]
MAKKVADKAPKAIETVVWEACNKLRGSVEPSEYKHVILSLIFLKYANDKFEEQKAKLIANGDEAFIEMPMFYTQDNVFFIPEESRWDYLIANAKQADIALKVDTALHEIEVKNPSLSGALPDNYYSRLSLGKGVLGQLLDKFNDINLKDSDDKDVFGRIYEYCLKKFAISEGKGKGEFYTPASVVSLLCELIEPYSGIVYDGACGSGGMFVQSIKFIDEHKGDKKGISVYGQEYTATTRKLAIMNLSIRGISANIGDRADSTFTNDLHPDLKADYALMNPPFNQKSWREETTLLDDGRWKGYEVPPVGNANYAWILNMISKLSQNGVGALLLANGALGADDAEKRIRKQLIENDLVEAIIILPRDMFYSTDISVTVWIFNKNKKARTVEKNGEKKELRDRTNEVLLIDYRQRGHVNDGKYIELNEDDRKEIADIYHNWQSIDKDNLYKDVAELCYSASKDEIKEKDYALMPSRYIEFINHDSEIDYKAELVKIQETLKKNLIEEKNAQNMLIDAFGGIGYDIE